MEPAQRHEKRVAKRLTRAEKAVIFGLTILASANAELGLTDRVSLDSLEQSIESAPLSFAMPLVLLASSFAIGFIWLKMESSNFRDVLGYVAIAPFVFGTIQLAELITP
jgi:heme/copper-type cytochrome/quinol oxidase subunit 3